MLSILPLESPAEAMRVQPEPPTVAPVANAAEESAPPDEAPEEFELVLGRKQVASVLFVAIVAVVVFSAISYLAGRALVPKAVAPAPVVTVPDPPPAPVAEAAVVKTPEFPLPDPAPAEPLAAQGQPVAPANLAPEPPVFASPAANGVYLQMGAVEKGIAVIMVDGLRKHGFTAFAAPGPTEPIYRVLIGPLADPEAFRRAKERVDQIGLNSFARKYQP